MSTAVEKGPRGQADAAQAVWLFLFSLALPETIALAVHLEDMDVMGKAIEERAGSFRNNEVGLQLHALAYNLGNFLRTPCPRR